MGITARPLVRTASRTRLVLLVGLLVLLVMAGAGVASASEQATGQTCTNEYFFNGQGLQILGHRCAKGSVVYSSQSSVLWFIDYYKILYTVTAGMSYGPHNNENPARVSSGYQSGQQSGLSPDSGVTGSWISRTYWGTTYTYKGQTTFTIDAYPDIPSVSDPDLRISTATW